MPESLRQLAVSATSTNPGAVAILQVFGDVTEMLRQVTGQAVLDDRGLALVDLDGVDRGLAVRLNHRVALIMPHGGMRIVQRLLAGFADRGVRMLCPSDVWACEAFPECADELEAMTHQALCKAFSPLAVELLLQQPKRWRAFDGDFNARDYERSQRLNRLISPATVVVAGRPNVGKSTLTNALLGRQAMIATDLAGTTRDYSTELLELGGIVIRWVDTPGIAQSADRMEQRAIALASHAIHNADLLIAMRDPHHDWPALPRRADAWVLNKCDLAGAMDRGDGDEPSHPLCISAKTGARLDVLVRTLQERLVPEADRSCDQPWLFDARLLGLGQRKRA